MSNEEDIVNTKADTTNIGDIIEDDDDAEFKEAKDKIQLTIKTKGNNVEFQLPDSDKIDKGIGDMKTEPTIHDLSLYIDDSNLSLSPTTENIETEAVYEVTFPIPEEKLVRNSNYIRTTKYTIWSFLPLNLISQV